MAAWASAIVVLVAASCTSGPTAQTSDGPTPLTFKSRPYLGVACPVPNSTACDRLGIAVWLDEKPSVAWVTVNGTRVELTTVSDEDPRGHWMTAYIQPAGFRDPPYELPEFWQGQPGVSVTLRVDATLRSGPATTTVTAGLHPGWG